MDHARMNPQVDTRWRTVTPGAAPRVAAVLREPSRFYLGKPGRLPRFATRSSATVQFLAGGVDKPGLGYGFWGIWDCSRFEGGNKGLAVLHRHSGCQNTGKTLFAQVIDLIRGRLRMGALVLAYDIQHRSIRGE